MLKVSIETAEGLKRCLKVQVPMERLQKEVDERLQKAIKTARIPGFRVGKVPLSIIEKQYGPSIKDDVLVKLVSSTLMEALEQEKLHPAGQPKIDITPLSSDQPIEYKATFEIYPHIDLVTFEGVKIEQVDTTITEEDIDRAISDLKKNYITWKLVDRPAQLGDQVVVDFNGLIDGEPFQGGQNKNFAVILGSHQVLPEFEQRLVGSKAGEVFEVSVLFPTEHVDKTISGKTALFTVKVYRVSQSQQPEIDDAFYQRLGIESGGEEALRKRLKETLESQRRELIKRKNQSVVFDKLLSLNADVLIPQGLVEQEMVNMQHNAAAQISQMYGKNVVDFEKRFPKNVFEAESKKRVKLGLLVNAVMDKYKINLEDSKVQSLAREMVGSNTNPEELQAWWKKNPGALQQFKMMLLENAVSQQLLEQATVESKMISFRELSQQVDQDEARDG